MKSKRKRQERRTILKTYREGANLTQEQLAVHLGKSLSTVRRWEKGEEPSMTRPEWIRFCRLVGVNFDDLPESFSTTLIPPSGERLQETE